MISVAKATAPAVVPPVATGPHPDEPRHSDTLAALRLEIQRAAHLLPCQGPIDNFVHHNPLHMFEHLPFHTAVQQAAAIFGCQTYLSESQYHEHLRRGRIAWEDVQQCLLQDLGEVDRPLAAGLSSRREIRTAMLRYPMHSASEAELRWWMAQSGAVTRQRSEVPAAARHRLVDSARQVMMELRGDKPNAPWRTVDPALRASLGELLAPVRHDDVNRWSDAQWEALSQRLLWRICRQGVLGIALPPPPSPPPIRHRDLLLDAGGTDSDCLVNEFLIRLCAAFLDQGVSHEAMPGREHGFFQAVCQIYGSAAPRDRWLAGFSAELHRHQQERIDPLQSIDQSLGALGVEQGEREAYLVATLLALRGWAGMIWQLETTRPTSAAAVPAGTLTEYLAVRLILERLAYRHLARQTLGGDVSLAQLRSELRERSVATQQMSVDRRAFPIFQLAQRCGWSLATLSRLSKQSWQELVEEVEAFTPLCRRRILHEAYEKRYRDELLAAVAAAASRDRPAVTAPRLQAVFCIDDREESFRRHLEEVAGEAETFGVAGFFAVPMRYRGAAEAGFTPLCPAMIDPEHYVQEEVQPTHRSAHRRRGHARRALARAQRHLHRSSRTFVGGAFASLFGSLTSLPLVMRVLFPHTTTRLHRWAGRAVQPSSATRLQLQRSFDPPASQPGQWGFSLVERVAIVRCVLLEIGLVANFAPLVAFFGHGSSSVNNPHAAAYNCGACSGGRGGPNARVFAQLANDPAVRAVLAAEGLVIPESALFVAAYHNTCDDSVTWYDLASLPSTHRAALLQAKRWTDEARRRNAHERCRRFESAGLSLGASEALRHVEARANDLAQTRPEYNHATNAVTLVGRRWWSRGLFLDRRAFLNSYDPDIDDAQHSLLARTLQAAIPVCAGISLEYYFSCVDPEGWGCGSKLPHNVSALLGVMSGAASDLRPGLSQQMIEIHEPLRQLFVIESTPAAMEAIMDRNPAIGRLVRGRWVQLATLDPASAELHLYGPGGFEPYRPRAVALPRRATSGQWYQGQRDHLGFALIEPTAPPEPG